MRTDIRNVFRQLAAFFIFSLVLVLLLDKIVMPLYVRHGREIKLMDVRKQRAAEAVSLLKANGFQVEFADTVEAGNLPRGIIVDQQPPPGFTVKKGRIVRLVVTGGEHFFNMPNLVGKALRAAQLLVDGNKLLLDTVEYIYSSEKPEGVVCEQSLLPGSMVATGTSLRLVVSKGAPPRQLEVPNLTGLSLANARSAIRQAGFRVGIIRYVPNEELNPNTVLDQNPKAGRLYENPIPIDLHLTAEP